MFYYKRGCPIVAFGTKIFTSFWDLETYFTFFWDFNLTAPILYDFSTFNYETCGIFWMVKKYPRPKL